MEKLGISQKVMSMSAVAIVSHKNLKNMKKYWAYVIHCALCSCGSFKYKYKHPFVNDIYEKGHLKLYSWWLDPA